MKLLLTFFSFFALISSVRSQNIVVKAKADFAQVEGQDITLQFNRLVGTGTCSYTAKNSDSGATVKTGNINFSSSPETATIAASDIGSITQDVVIRTEISCDDSTNQAYGWLETKYLELDAFGSPNPTIQLTSTVDVVDVAQNPANVAVNSDSGSITCTFTIDDSSKATTSASDFLVNPSTTGNSFTQQNSATDTFVTLTCPHGGKSYINNVPVLFDYSPANSGSGDPHFQQFVSDSLHGSKRKICYDVTGNPNEYLHVVGLDSKPKANIYGQLKDDYYFHKILLKSKQENITFGVDEIIFESDAIMIWDDNMVESFKTKHFSVQIKNDIILVSSLSDSDFSIKIVRFKHSLDVNHLDVSFSIPRNDYSKITGMVGEIGKRKFDFYESVQKTEEIFAAVNKELKKGRKVIRDNSNCALFSVDDLLKPMKVTDFFSKSLN